MVRAQPKQITRIVAVRSKPKSFQALNRGFDAPAPIAVATASNGRIVWPSSDPAPGVRCALNRGSRSIGCSFFASVGRRHPVQSVRPAIGDRWLMRLAKPRTLKLRLVTRVWLRPSCRQTNSV